MKNRNAKRILAAGAAAVLAVGLTACGGKENKADDKTITVAASPTPHAEILEASKDLLKEKGYTLEIKEFDDYPQQNVVVDEESLMQIISSTSRIWIILMKRRDRIW